MDVGSALVVSAMAAVVLFGVFFNDTAVLRRKLRKIGAAPIRDLREESTARIRGTVEILAHEPQLFAPLSGRACTAFVVLITEHVGSSTRTVLRETQCVDFLVRDTTGVARIAVHGEPNVDAAFDFEIRNVDASQVDPRIDYFMRTRGLDPTSMKTRNLVFQEGVLAIGESITALGRVSFEEGVGDPKAIDAGYRESALRRRAVLLPPVDESLILSDHVRTVRSS